jgi:hypothetical protein
MPSPIDLGSSVQIPYSTDWTAIQNGDGTIDLYDSLQKCSFHWGCNSGGCPSISHEVNREAINAKFLVIVPLPLK